MLKSLTSEENQTTDLPFILRSLGQYAVQKANNAFEKSPNLTAVGALFIASYMVSKFASEDIKKATVMMATISGMFKGQTDAVKIFADIMKEFKVEDSQNDGIKPIDGESPRNNKQKPVLSEEELVVQVKEMMASLPPEKAQEVLKYLSKLTPGKNTAAFSAAEIDQRTANSRL
jgi:hypothetical protein